MRMTLDENAKRRLTERAEISLAVDFLISHGFAADEIPGQLVKFYYVDIDMLNSVLVDDPPAPVTIPGVAEAWKRVA